MVPTLTEITVKASLCFIRNIFIRLGEAVVIIESNMYNGSNVMKVYFSLTQ